MTNIIQSVSITKHINPSKQISDEYTLMIGYHDVIYISKIKQEDFNSVLFEFDMLENLIYNCNHKQKVGDICCDMTITESESFGKILDITLLFERDVKPMKKINEKHGFQLQEKKLDYDDKIGLAMTNLRNEINFVTIKPTTEIVIIGQTELIIGDQPKNKKNTKIIQKSKKKIMTDSDTETDSDTDSDKSKKENKENKESLDYYLKNNFIDMIKIKDGNNLIIFIDETKKPNNRKIKFYKLIDEFEKSREQFKTYHILDMNSFGILIEEIE